MYLQLTESSLWLIWPTGKEKLKIFSKDLYIMIIEAIQEAIMNRHEQVNKNIGIMGMMTVVRGNKRLSGSFSTESKQGSILLFVWVIQ